MSDVAVKRASLWRETWDAITESFPSLWPWVVGFGLVLTIPWFFIQSANSMNISEQMKQNPLVLQQNPEIASQYFYQIFAFLSWFLPTMFFTHSIATYCFTVRYLQLAMKRNRPELSVGGYFYWLGKMLLKYLRPLVWVLIPIIGLFFYLRSTVRYQVVSPLAVLHRGEELKTSWNLTDGHWWRVFGNYIITFLLVWIPMVIAMMVVGLMVGVVGGVYLALAHQPQSLFLAHTVAGFSGGLTGGVLLFASSIYSCTVFRVLSQEARQTAIPLQADGNPPP